MREKSLEQVQHLDSKHCWNVYVLSGYSRRTLQSTGFFRIKEQCREVEYLGHLKIIKSIDITKLFSNTECASGPHENPSFAREDRDQEEG